MNDNPDLDHDPLAIACELVCRFQYHFSKIEEAMNQGIAKTLNLDDSARDIVCSNLDFVKKINIIKAAIAVQLVDKEGSASAVLDKAAGINNPDRQVIIHSTFEPLVFGKTKGVRFTRIITNKGELKRSTQDWPCQRFTNFFSSMEAIAAELERIVAQLKPYTPSLHFSDLRNSMCFPLLT
jgi:hypothetical protein